MQYIELERYQGLIFDMDGTYLFRKQAAHSGGMDCVMVESGRLVFYPCV